MTLLLILITGFLTSITSETTSAGSYAAGTSAKILADSGIEMVTSQIRLATLSGSSSITWTSQPGLLRTFDSSGNKKEVFKLYSADKMRVAASDYNETDDSLASSETSAWSNAVYADINQPAANNQGDLVYPVLDPRAASDDPGAAAAKAATGRLPVTDFTLDRARTPGYSGGTPSPANNPAAMPVRWLYILQDGKIAVPQSESASGDISFSPADAQPSRDNPIIGRVAFWTDDETCKLNINTAGYGLNDYNYWSYWDTPHVYSNDEKNFLSKNRPWKGEYQRYPGHPATTGITRVFPELAKYDLFKAMPRLRADSTAGGAGSDGGVNDCYTIAATALAHKQDRLYASVDELLYNIARSPNLPTATGTLSSQDLDTKRFFLTAHSRAPELNLFGQPRVTIWPISHTSTDRTGLDKTIALCGTVGKEKFYFTRRDSASATNDINLSDSYGSNLKLYGYLQRMTSKKIPGFGGPARGFVDKYADDRDQILTEIFDTIRITNLNDQSPAAVPYTSSATSKPDQMLGQVIPTLHPTNGTRGAGRFFIITEATVVFVNMGSSVTGSPGANDKTKLKMGILLKFWQPAAGAIAGGANLNYKITGLDSFYIKANNDSGVSEEMQLFSTGSIYQHALREYRFAAVYGGANPKVSVISDTDQGANTSSGNGTYALPATSNECQIKGSTFQFKGGTITVEVRAPATNLTGDVLQSYTFSFPPITSNLTVPPYNPTTDTPWNTLSASQQSTVVSGTPAFSGTGRFYSTSGALNFIQQYEVARSVQLATGDYRSLAYLKTGSSSLFTTPPAYDTTCVQAQGLVYYGGAGVGRSRMANVPQCVPGNLVSGLSIFDTTQAGGGPGGSKAPDVPIGINFVKNANGNEGDWDNGYGFLQDGSYLPKSDEGVLYNPNVNTSCYGYFYSSNIDKSMFEGNLPTLFSANCQVPSAVLFGGLPTGVVRNKPWQTLLFRPARDYHMGGNSHPGTVSPPDYLLLDLFQMPVVEPYAISEPLSTAGKVNLNYRIKPFDEYIKRDTAVRAVLESTMITAIPNTAETGYKSYMGTPTSPFAAYPGRTRWLIDSTETLKCFDQHIAGKNAFVSETEICDVDLVPKGWTADSNSLTNFWSDKRTTGDNSRERPYALIYPRLTTRSNTYTVHVFAQALNPTASNRGGWNSKTGRVVGEWRGESTIERYVDPNDPDIPSFLGADDANLDNLYHFRTVYSKRFSP